MYTEKRAWFAWRPVRLGALSSGELTWLSKVTRIDTRIGGVIVSIYQPLEVDHA
jgi:hypothetical protein